MKKLFLLLAAYSLCTNLLFAMDSEELAQNSRGQEIYDLPEFTDYAVSKNQLNGISQYKLLKITDSKIHEINSPKEILAILNIEIDDSQTETEIAQEALMALMRYWQTAKALFSRIQTIDQNKITAQESSMLVLDITEHLMADIRPNFYHRDSEKINF